MVAQADSFFFPLVLFDAVGFLSNVSFCYS